MRAAVKREYERLRNKGYSEKRAMRLANLQRGVILYSGPSEFDGAPMVCIATFKTANAKTGPMIQTWIFRRDMSPTRAINTGADKSGCNNCKLRGIIVRGKDGRIKNTGRVCYVRVANAPSAVYSAFKRGVYEAYSAEKHAHLFAGRKLRMGSYGDPTAIPIDVWETILPICNGHSGYTHSWQTVSKRWARYLMASVDTLAEKRAAQRKGYRTFRTRAIGAPIETNEIACPASAEAGMRRTCDTCGACRGGALSKASVTIVTHGGLSIMSNYRKLALPVV